MWQCKFLGSMAPRNPFGQVEPLTTAACIAKAFHLLRPGLHAFRRCLAASAFQVLRTALAPFALTRGSSVWDHFWRCHLLALFEYINRAMLAGQIGSCSCPCFCRKILWDVFAWTQWTQEPLLLLHIQQNSTDHPMTARIQAPRGLRPNHWASELHHLHQALEEFSSGKYAWMKSSRVWSEDFRSLWNFRTHQVHV